MIKLKKLIIFITILVIVTPGYSYAHNNILNEHSKSAILIDQDTNRVLYEKQADEKRPIASLTKMMTFLIAIEAIKDQKVNGDDLVEIDKQIAAIKGSTCHLEIGEKVELKELMKGLMLVSGNDAAMAIAKHIGGSEEGFVKLMNENAKKIGLNNTYFINTNGLPVYDTKNPELDPKENQSTARDVAILGKYMFDNYQEEVTEVTAMHTYSNEMRHCTYNNTNPLLVEVSGVDGIKTGYTDRAGYCLAFSMEVSQDNNNAKDHRLLGVVLGTGNKNDRKIAAESILKYGKDEFHMEKIAQKGQIIGKEKVQDIDGLELELKAGDDVYAVLSKNEIFTPKIEVQSEKIKYPIRDGDEVGIVKYYNDSGEFIQSGKLLNSGDTKKLPIKTKTKILYKYICNLFNK